MEIITGRLRIIPFTIEIIQSAMDQDGRRLAEMGIIPTDEWPEADLLEALPYFNQQLLEHGVTGYNSWLILDRWKSAIIGSIGFINEPDENGCVEIGFGIIPGKRRNGYCEEAARALIEWAAAQNNVRMITAQCNLDNVPSIKLLTKMGFQMTACDQSLISWKRIIQKQLHENSGLFQARMKEGQSPVSLPIIRQHRGRAPVDHV